MSKMPAFGLAQRNQEPLHPHVALLQQTLDLVLLAGVEELASQISLQEQIPSTAAHFESACMQAF